MIRLAKYVENEFDRNALFFAQAYSSLMASCDFIDYLLNDKNLVNLNEEEICYVNKIKQSYIQLIYLTNKIAEEIKVYKDVYSEFFNDVIPDNNNV